MKIIDNFLDLLRLKPTEGEKKYKQQLQRDALKGEINSSVTYDDIKKYDRLPFNLNQEIRHDDRWSYILFDSENLKTAYTYFDTINNLLLKYRSFFDKEAKIPNKILTGRNFTGEPNSHIRLEPYTSTMREYKYPVILWLCNYGENESGYLYRIYLNNKGNIGKCDITLDGTYPIQVTYQIQIRTRNGGLYVRRIDRTIYYEPYGTKTLYYDDAK